MFGFSWDVINDWSNRVYLIATICSISFAGLALLASFFMWRSSNEISAGKDRELALFQATAGERAAALENEAQSAKLETERLKSSVAWRSLTPAQSTALVNALKANPGSVNLRYMDGDPESLYLAAQISQLLAQAGWNVAGGAMKPGNSILFGIWIPDSKPLADAFAAADIPAESQPMPNQAVVTQFNVSVIPNAPLLFVGPRRPPAFQ